MSQLVPLYYQKLVKASTMLCKLRHFVSVGTIESIYYAVLHSHLSCLYYMESKSEP